MLLHFKRVLTYYIVDPYIATLQISPIKHGHTHGQNRWKGQKRKILKRNRFGLRKKKKRSEEEEERGDHVKGRRWRRSLEKKKTREEIGVRRRRRRRRRGRRSISMSALRGLGFHLLLFFFFFFYLQDRIPQCPERIQAVSQPYRIKKKCGCACSRIQAASCVAYESNIVTATI